MKKTRLESWATRTTTTSTGIRPIRVRYWCGARGNNYFDSCQMVITVDGTAPRGDSNEERSESPGESTVERNGPRIQICADDTAAPTPAIHGHHNNKERSPTAQRISIPLRTSIFQSQKTPIRECPCFHRHSIPRSAFLSDREPPARNEQSFALNPRTKAHQVIPNNAHGNTSDKR
jgi:hypothetical protein